MKKKGLVVLICVSMLMGIMTGCGKQPAAEQNAEVVESRETEEGITEETQAEAEEAKIALTDETEVHLAGLKGPTSMGLAKLVEDGTTDQAAYRMTFTMGAAADELIPSFIQGNLDLMAVPANLASVLYNKTEGKTQVLAVNTLGVLYIVDTGDSVQTLADLKGKTILSTGQGATPEYSLRHLLTENGLDPDKDVTVEWKSEATEIVSAMAASDEEVIAMLPQPFVTVAATKVENLRVAIDMNEEWNQIEKESGLVTGVLVGRSEFIQEHPQLVEAILVDYEESVNYVNQNPEDASLLIEKLDIVKAPIAQKAIPECNIVFLTGAKMQTKLEGYLQVLEEQNPASIGGKLPEADFYFQ